MESLYCVLLFVVLIFHFKFIPIAAGISDSSNYAFIDQPLSSMFTFWRTSQMSTTNYSYRTFPKSNLNGKRGLNITNTRGNFNWIALGQSGICFYFDFSFPTDISIYQNGGGHKFYVTAQRLSANISYESNKFHQNQSSIFICDLNTIMNRQILCC